ncbi:hypothetical protein [Nocardioides albertanoniae]|nr:hypothetical protein [Nocardioides albertanoniae]
MGEDQQRRLGTFYLVPSGARRTHDRQLLEDLSDWPRLGLGNPVGGA